MLALAFIASRLRGASAEGGAPINAQLIRTTWGVPEFEHPSRWKEWMLATANGPIAYAGIEAPTWVPCLGAPIYESRGLAHGCNATRAALFRDALAASSLFYVAQIHVCGVPIQSASVEDALSSLEAQANLAKDLGASLLNVHDGVDIWSDDDVLAYFKGALEIERKVGLPMAHETHRTRARGADDVAATFFFKRREQPAATSFFGQRRDRHDPQAGARDAADNPFGPRRVPGSQAHGGPVALGDRRGTRLRLPVRRRLVAAGPRGRRERYCLDAQPRRLRGGDPGQRSERAGTPRPHRDLRVVVEYYMVAPARARRPGTRPVQTTIRSWRRRGRDVDISWSRVAATPLPRSGMPVGDSSRRGRGRDVDMPVETSRGDAAAATWIFRAEESRRRRGRDVDMPVQTSRGDAAAATWKFRGD